MKISAISFGQKYISSVWVKNAKTNKGEQMDFVEFEDCPQDKVLLQYTANLWDKLTPLSYGSTIYDDYVKANEENYFDKKFYGLVDDRGNIQALSEINEGDKELNFYDPELPNKDVFEISYLNTNPKSNANKEKREYKGLGTAMVRELVVLADRKKKKYVSLSDANYMFWCNMPFFEDKYNSQTRILEDKNYQECLKKLDETI